MPQSTISLEVTTDHPVPVEPSLAGSVTVVNVSGDILYYGDAQVSADNNRGSLTAGLSQQFTIPMWVRSAGLSTVTITTDSTLGGGGAPGPPGPAGPQGPVGLTGLNFKGAWSTNGPLGTGYSADDSVGFGGASYFALHNIPPGGANPTIDTTNWALLAAQGATGPPGPAGPAGSGGGAASGSSGPGGAAQAFTGSSPTIPAPSAFTLWWGVMNQPTVTVTMPDPTTVRSFMLRLDQDSTGGRQLAFGVTPSVNDPTGELDIRLGVVHGIQSVAFQTNWLWCWSDGFVWNVIPVAAPPTIAALSYGTTVTPSASAELQTVAVTNTTAFTLANPTFVLPAGLTGEFTVEVFNNSGGVMGAITWGNLFVFTQGAWTNPATGKKRFARFMWNGANWIATSMATVDY